MSTTRRALAFADACWQKVPKTSTCQLCISPSGRSSATAPQVDARLSLDDDQKSKQEFVLFASKLSAPLQESSRQKELLCAVDEINSSIMYSASSPVLNSLDVSPSHPASSSLGSQHTSSLHRHHQQLVGSGPSGQCLRFKFFATFLICTTCLALLSASLVTHKWIVSKPIRMLKLNNGQTNLTSLMLTAQNDNNQRSSRLISPLLSALSAGSEQPGVASLPAATSNNKFQGEIHFGLFKGVKVLNYGFGDRVSPISGESFSWQPMSFARALQQVARLACKQPWSPPRVVIDSFCIGWPLTS